MTESTSNRDSPKNISQKNRCTTWMVGLVGTGVLSVLLVLFYTFHSPKPIVFNFSKSVPIGIYVNTAISKPYPTGTYVMIGNSTMKKFYRFSGHDDEPKLQILKVILAKPHDQYCVNEYHLVSNGHFLIRAARSSKGDPPPPIAYGCFTLGPGQYLVTGTSQSSFDSRYIGPINENDIIQTVTPFYIP